MIQGFILQIEPSATMSLLERFGDAGLVFLVMAIVIGALYREWRRERDKKEKAQSEFNEYLKTTDKENDKTMTEFSKLVEALAEKIIDLKNEVKENNKH